jgi:L-alanine-DL-glutamate epimerase-like enolase superfamily enzyme
VWGPEHRDFIFKEPVRIDSEGFVHLPQGPGLGIELDEDRLAQYEQNDTSRLI